MLRKPGIRQYGSLYARLSHLTSADDHNVDNQFDYVADESALAHKCTAKSYVCVCVISTDPCAIRRKYKEQQDINRI